MSTQQVELLTPSALSVPLTKGQYALVDFEDYELVREEKWYVCSKSSNTFYAERQEEGKTLSMGRLILDAEPGEIVDHINGNGLDNRKCNLRIVTKSQNGANMRLHKINSSGFKGVHWDKKNKKWKVELMVDCKRIWVGRFNDLSQAIKAYNDTAKTYFGEYSRTHEEMSCN
jgi:hypothetical protein